MKAKVMECIDKEDLMLEKTRIEKTPNNFTGPW